MTEYKILKLQSGEEIICDVISKEHPRTFEIKSPLKVNVLPKVTKYGICLLYTSPSPRDRTRSRMPSSA